MQTQDEAPSEDLLDCEESVSSSFDNPDPQVTADGYNYWMLLMQFQEVMDKPGTKQPQPGFFLAPGTSCTFSLH